MANCASWVVVRARARARSAGEDTAPTEVPQEVQKVASISSGLAQFEQNMATSTEPQRGHVAASWLIHNLMDRGPRADHRDLEGLGERYSGRARLSSCIDNCFSWREMTEFSSAGYGARCGPFERLFGRLIFHGECYASAAQTPPAGVPA